MFLCNQKHCGGPSQTVFSLHSQNRPTNETLAKEETLSKLITAQKPKNCSSLQNKVVHCLIKDNFRNYDL